MLTTAGTLSSFSTGVRLRTRYQHLLERTSLEKTPTKFWASDSNRVIETAKHFAAGFFGIDYNIANMFGQQERRDRRPAKRISSVE
jgi:acid phosphatase